MKGDASMTIGVCEWLKHRVEMVISSSMFNNQTESKEWKLRKKCGIGYEYNAWDLKVTGCDNINEISENDIEFDGFMYIWQCKHCDLWHEIPENQIPQEVRQRIKNRRH